MTIRNLQYLFRPASVAVIGASDRPQSVGATVMHNLLSGGYSGTIVPVNPNHDRNFLYTELLKGCSVRFNSILLELCNRNFLNPIPKL